MEKRTYSEYYDFEEKLLKKAKTDLDVARRVIESECGVSIVSSWNEILCYYSTKEIMDVMGLSAEKSIISSNSKYYILHDNFFECADDLMEIYGDNFDQTVFDMWGNGNHDPIIDLFGEVDGDIWRVCYIDNKPSNLDMKIIDRLVANKEYDLLVELARERAWAIYWD
nr:MAG TPA: hypothetical protein [Caudoviricetes sp.]